MFTRPGRSITLKNAAAWKEDDEGKFDSRQQLDLMTNLQPER